MRKWIITLCLLLLAVAVPAWSADKVFNTYTNGTTIANTDEFVYWKIVEGDVYNIAWSAFIVELKSDMGFIDWTSDQGATNIHTGNYPVSASTISDASTIGQNILKSTNPDAIRFGRANADNSYSWLSDSDFRTALGLAIGTNVQAYDADLTYLAGFTPSDNVKTILNAANNAAIKTALGYPTSGDYQTTLTNPVTGVASPTAGYLTKWGVSGNAIVDGPKIGTFTDAKWCSFTTAGGLQCTEAAPAGTGDVTAASAFGADNNIVVSDGTGKGVKASGVTINATTKVITVPKQSGVAGVMSLYEANSTDTYQSGRIGADNLTYSYLLKYPGTRPASANVFEVCTNAGESGDGSAGSPFVQTCSWADLDNYSTPSSTDTWTNKTYNFASTGNDLTVPLNGVFDNSITDPADADDLLYAKSMNAATITDIYCVAEGGGTITLTLQECDATGASCGNIEGAITCDSDGAEDDGTLTDGAFAANGWIKALFSAPTGTVNSLAWSVKGTQTW